MRYKHVSSSINFSHKLAEGLPELLTYKKKNKLLDGSANNLYIKTELTNMNECVLLHFSIFLKVFAAVFCEDYNIVSFAIFYDMRPISTLFAL